MATKTNKQAAIDEGYAAYIAGKWLAECPYAEEYEEYSHWCDGWNQAEEEHWIDENYGGDVYDQVNRDYSPFKMPEDTKQVKSLFVTPARVGWRDLAEINMTDLEKCATYTWRGDRCEIKCKLGLWSVEGPYGLALLNEAEHYFQQYKADGEYDKLLAV